MMRIQVIQNDLLSPPALVGDSLLSNGHHLTLSIPKYGGAVCCDLADYDGLLVLGGPMSAMDSQQFPYLDQVCEAIRVFSAASRPVLGICLGAQLIARAFGAAVYPHSVSEFGYVSITPTAAAVTDPVCAALPATARFNAFHDDTFDLPKQATLLATGSACTHQAFRIGRATYGFQCHFETTKAVARAWAQLPEAIIASGKDDPMALIEEHLKQDYDEGARLAAMMTESWQNLGRIA
jgi:GMP synthase-like glutamine amidotransferase